jgi:hypothetical protein
MRRFGSGVLDAFESIAESETVLTGIRVVVGDVPSPDS